MISDPGLPNWLLPFEADFPSLAHRHQEPPAFANGGGPWTTWLMLGGRGAGKTRLGAEWVRASVHGTRPYADQCCLNVALVGETEHDVREVMIEGPAGILRVSPRHERPQWTPTRRRLEWPNGAVGLVFSAEDPEQLRGPQFDAAWCDELAKWRHVDATFDMLQFGLRLGLRPRQLITTTPRPIALIKRLLADPRTAVTRAPRPPTPRISRLHFSMRCWPATPARGSDGRRSMARSSRIVPMPYGRGTSLKPCACQKRHRCYVW